MLLDLSCLSVYFNVEMLLTLSFRVRAFIHKHHMLVRLDSSFILSEEVLDLCCANLYACFLPLALVENFIDF